MIKFKNCIGLIGFGNRVLGFILRGDRLIKSIIEFYLFFYTKITLLNIIYVVIFCNYLDLFIILKQRSSKFKKKKLTFARFIPTKNWKPLEL